MGEALLIVRTDQLGAETIDRIVQDNGGAAGIVTQPRYLGGDVLAWMVAVTALTQALPPLLAAIKDLMAKDRVEGIEIDGVKVTNPTPEIVERLLKEHLGAEG